MRKLSAAFKSYIAGTDLLLLLIAVITSAYGMLLISSATYAGSSTRPLIVQGIAIALGVGAYIFLTWFDIEHLSFLWKAVFFCNLILLATTLFWGVGMESTGNNSWIRFTLGGVETGIQPGEIGKILFIFTLAKHFQVLGDDLNTFRGLLMLILHAVIVVGFVYVFSKDDGMALSYLFIFVIMAFAGGIYLRFCAVGLVGIAAALPLVWTFVLGQYQRDRFIVLFDGTYKADSVGYHQRQSVAAITSGGLWGDGLYQGSITQSGSLPAKQTDFIFSVACEELGFLGAALILILFALLIVRIYCIALHCRDRYSALAVTGIGTLLAVQVFLNVAVVTNLVPCTGISLPFFSYGGSALWLQLTEMGIVLSASRDIPETDENG